MSCLCWSKDDYLIMKCICSTCICILWLCSGTNAKTACFLWMWPHFTSSHGEGRDSREQHFTDILPQSTDVLKRFNCECVYVNKLDSSIIVLFWSNLILVCFCVCAFSVKCFSPLSLSAPWGSAANLRLLLWKQHASLIETTQHLHWV